MSDIKFEGAVSLYLPLSDSTQSLGFPFALYGAITARLISQSPH